VKSDRFRQAVALVGALAMGGLGTVALAAPTGATDASTTGSNGIEAAGSLSPVRLGPAPALPTEVPATTPGGDLHATSAGSTFVVNYDAGFDANPAAKTAFQFAVDQWASVISSPVPITVDASFTALDPGILGSAGPSSVFRDFSGAPQPATWYPVALANARHGSDLDPGNADISAQFSSSYSNFFFGTDGATGGKVDFASVVLHELGHGLGFLGIARTNGDGTGSCCLGGYPLTYDRFTTSNGTDVLSFADGSTALGNALQGQVVRFAGAQATAANGGTAPRLYAPASWQGGSSYSHLDETTFPAGDPNSLMTPAIGPGEVIHAPGPVTLGIFADSGWAIGVSLPTLAIAGSRVVEGNAGRRYVRVNVTLSDPVAWPVTATYATSDRTARASSDYVAKHGSISIPAGTTSTSVSISIVGDRTPEPAEKLAVGLSNPAGATLGQSRANVVILNDDVTGDVTVSIGNASAWEGDSGAHTVRVSVTLSKAQARAVHVSWATGDGSATAGVDYIAASGRLTIPAWTTYGTVDVVVQPDTAPESPESFPIRLSSPTHAALWRASGTVSLSDDD
jgi:Calx-beta domain